MTDGSDGNIIVAIERDAVTLGFVDAIRGFPIEENPYSLTREQFYAFDRWRIGWRAYHARCIPLGVQQALHDVPQMRNPLTEEHLQSHGYLSEVLEDLLKKKCVRP